jgi:hypothetical protein
MIRSGWRKLSFSFTSPVAGTISLFADLGFIDDDLQIGSYSVNANFRYGFMPEGPTTASGAITYISTLSCPVNAFIIKFAPNEQAAGTLQLHLVRGA